MALHDMAKMTVTGTPGTGTITLNAAVSGFQTFAAAGVTNSEVVSYSISDGTSWEIGRGAYTTSGTTLTRGPIYSSNSNAAISATSAAIVAIAALAEDIVSWNSVDSAAPVAITWSHPSVISGTSNTAGVDWTFVGSKGTGTGAGGNIIFKTAPAGTTGTAQNAAAEIFKLTTTTVNFFNSSGAIFNSISSSFGVPGLNIQRTAGAPGVLRGIAISFGPSATVDTAETISIFGQAGQSAAIGLNSLGVLGWHSATSASAVNLATASFLDTKLTRGGVASLQQGNVDAAAPVAQTLQVQSVVAGTSNTAGVDWTFQGSRGTGTGVGGDIIFKTAPAGSTGTTQNAAAEVARLLSAGNVKFTNAANFSANGSVATVLGSIGPTGAQTTVQTWLTIVDSTGAARYIPCF